MIRPTLKPMHYAALVGTWPTRGTMLKKRRQVIHRKGKGRLVLIMGRPLQGTGPAQIVVALCCFNSGQAMDSVPVNVADLAHVTTSRRALRTLHYRAQCWCPERGEPSPCVFQMLLIRERKGKPYEYPAYYAGLREAQQGAALGTGDRYTCHRERIAWARGWSHAGLLPMADYPGVPQIVPTAPLPDSTASWVAEAHGEAPPPPVPLQGVSPDSDPGF